MSETNGTGKRMVVVQRGVVPTIEQSPEGAGTVEPAITFVPAGHAEGVVLWQDMAELEALPREQRRTLVTRATEGVPDEALPQFFRVLDGDCAEVFPLHIAPPARVKPQRRVG